MKNIRLIGRLDIKPPDLIKPVSLDGVRKIGSPIDYSFKYYREGIDELLYLDVVASLYGLGSTASLVSQVADSVSIPITVGGGLRTIEDIDLMMRSGADKVVLNTAAVQNPNLITQAALRYGNQSIVISLQGRCSNGKVSLFTAAGRNLITKSHEEYIQELYDRGAGEIMITSIDMDGRMKGMDIPLIREINNICPVPVIASSGVKNADSILHLLEETTVEGIAIGASLHYNKVSIESVKSSISHAGYGIRK